MMFYVFEQQKKLIVNFYITYFANNHFLIM